MKLGDARRAFTRLLPDLIRKAEELGFEPAIDYAKRCKDCSVGRSNSLHKDGLAIDLHLYRDGLYLPESEHHKELGAYWETLDNKCSWGGRFSDGNHYSFRIDMRR